MVSTDQLRIGLSVPLENGLDNLKIFHELCLFDNNTTKTVPGSSGQGPAADEFIAAGPVEEE